MKIKTPTRSSAEEPAGRTMTEKRMLLKIMISYAFSFALIDLADTTSMVIDGLIVSRGISATALAAIGIADPTFKAVSLFCGVFAVGLRYVCSSYIVKGNRKKSDAVFTFGILFTCVLAAAAVMIGYLFTGQICGILGADGSDPELYENLFAYLRGWFIGIPGLVCFLVFSPIVTLDDNKKCVTAATALQSVLNIAGDTLSAFVMKTGTFGIGLSTGIAFDVSALLLLLNFLRKRSMFRLSSFRPDKNDVRTVFMTGMPRVTKYACKMLLPLVVFRIAAAVGGSSAIAAITIKNDIAGFCLALGCGIAESVGLMGELFYHENDRNSLKMLLKLSFVSNAVLNLLLSALLFAVSPLIVSAFVDSGTVVYRMALTAARCLSLSLVFNGMNALIAAYLQAIKKLTVTHFYITFYKFLSLAACTFAFGRIFGLNGLFYAIPVSELVTFALYLLLVLFRKKRQIQPSPDAFLMLDPDFGYAEENSICISVVNTEQVMQIAKRIYDFCKERDIDRLRTYYAALCMEELAGNVVDHGFKKDNKEHVCNIRFILENGEITMRIRDNCKYFNIVERYELMETAGDMKNIGIRMAFGMAKDIRYVHIIGTNTLVITL